MALTSIRYIDTRAQVKEAIPFSSAVVEGLAPGGGLFVPETLPHLTLENLQALADKPYWQRATYLYRTFGVDTDTDAIDELMQRAYGNQFDTPEICPITSLDEKTHILELWHGPTSAFKDMALQCLPLFFTESARQLRARGELDNEFMILVATSGDTGSAALVGFSDVEGVSIGVLFPDGGVSDIQHRQMCTVEGANTHAWAARGNFDDCQTAVKKIFGDAEFTAHLKDQYGIALSSANSINWGRLLPQVVYYVSSYVEMVRTGKVAMGDLIDVCVPTGNFGNILAAWYAKQIGTPIDKLICASNENCVLSDFINTGTYDISHREFSLTPAPSMDILVSSNLERQLFELCGRDGNKVRQWMKDLNEKKCFSVDDTTRNLIQSEYRGAWVDSATCLATIKETFDAYGYLIDPHTAVAVKVAQQFQSDKPMLIASTAHWAKFGPDVYRALHGMGVHDALPADVAQLSGCELNRLIASEAPGSNIPVGLAALDQKELRFKETIDADLDVIKQTVTSFLTEQAKGN